MKHAAKERENREKIKKITKYFTNSISFKLVQKKKKKEDMQQRETENREENNLRFIVSTSTQTKVLKLNQFHLI